MKATSVQNIKNVKDVSFLLADDPIEMGSNFTIIARTNDDIFKFEFEGGLDLLQSCKAAGLFTGWEKDQKIRELEQEKENLKEHINNFNDVLMRNNELKEENRNLKNKVIRELKDIKKEINKLKKQLEQVEPETPITDAMLVDDYNRLVKENEELDKENKELEESNDRWKNEYRDLFKNFDEVQDKLIAHVLELEKLKTPTLDFVDEKPSTRADILDQAKKCVCGQREQDYGTPESNFQLIADLWNHYLGFTDYMFELEECLMDLNDKGIKVDVDIPKPKIIFPEDVAMMMALLKIARIRNGGGSGDSFVDLAGYAACGGEIWARERNLKDQK